MSKVVVTKEKLDSLANSISNKSGESTPLSIDDMIDAVDGIVIGGTPVVESLSVTPSETQQTYNSSSVDGYKPVTVGAIPSNYVGSGITRRSSSDMTASGATVTAPAGYYANASSKTVASGTVVSSIEYADDDPDIWVDSSGVVHVSGGYSASVHPVSSSGWVNSSTTTEVDIGVSGTYQLPTGTEGTPTATKGTVSNHSVTVTPSVTNSAGYISGGTKTGTGVSVSASELVSGTYTVSASGTHDVTNYASASVASGTATASATKGTVSNHSVTVTPSVTRTAGYVTAGTATGTGVSVSASELVSGSQTITQNGTVDVTNLASVTVAVEGGGDVTTGWRVANGLSGTDTASSITLAGETVDIQQDVTWIQGTIDGTNGNGGTGSTRIHTTEYYQVLGDSITITAPDTLKYSYRIYSAADYTGYIQSESLTVWNSGTNTYSITPGRYIRFVSAYTGDGSIAPTEGANLTLTYSMPLSNIGAFIISANETVSNPAAGDIAAIIHDSNGTRAYVYYSNNAQEVTNLTYSISSNTLTVSGSTYHFNTDAGTAGYRTVVVYGGTGDFTFRTDTYAPASGVTSAQYSISENPPLYFIGLSSSVAPASYHRVQTVTKYSTLSGTNFYTNTWGYLTGGTNINESYSNGTLTVSTNNYNDGGYFHNPGTYTIFYALQDDLDNGSGGGGGNYQTRSVSYTPTTSQQTAQIRAESSYDALEQVNITVNAIPSQYIVPSGNINITQNTTGSNTIDVSQYATATVNVSSGGSVNVATTTWTNSSSTATTHTFTGLSGTPKAAFLRCTTSLSRSSNSSNYFVADMRWTGTATEGNSFRRSNGTYANVTSGYSFSASGTSLTVSTSGTSTSNPGSFYNGTYELTYIY